MEASTKTREKPEMLRIEAFVGGGEARTSRVARRSKVGVSPHLPDQTGYAARGGIY